MLSRTANSLSCLTGGWRVGAAILAGAKQAGLETDGDVVKLCGVRWRLLD